MKTLFVGLASIALSLTGWVAPADKTTSLPWANQQKEIVAAPVADPQPDPQPDCYQIFADAQRAAAAERDACLAIPEPGPYPIDWPQACYDTYTAKMKAAKKALDECLADQTPMPPPNLPPDMSHEWWCFIKLQAEMAAAFERYIQCWLNGGDVDDCWDTLQQEWGEAAQRFIDCVNNEGGGGIS